MLAVTLLYEKKYPFYGEINVKNSSFVKFDKKMFRRITFNYVKNLNEFGNKSIVLVSIRKNPEQ